MVKVPAKVPGVVKAVAPASLAFADHLCSSSEVTTTSEDTEPRIVIVIAKLCTCSSTSDIILSSLSEKSPSPGR